MYAISAAASVDPFREHNAAAELYRGAQYAQCDSTLRTLVARSAAPSPSSSSPSASTSTYLNPEQLLHTQRLLQRAEALASLGGGTVAVPSQVLSWRVHPEIPGRPLSANNDQERP